MKEFEQLRIDLGDDGMMLMINIFNLNLVNHYKVLGMMILNLDLIKHTNKLKQRFRGFAFPIHEWNQ